MAALSTIKGKYELTSLVSEDLLTYFYHGKSRQTLGPIFVWVYKTEYLNPDIVEEMIQIAEKAVTIRHKNVLSLIDYHYDGEQFYAIYDPESLDIKTLEETLKETPSTNVVLWKWITHIMAALIEINNKHVVHGLLNMSSVYLSNENEIKVARMGLSIPILRKHLHHFEVVEDAIFLAPEVVQNQNFNTRSDMYALGVIMYVFFSGTWPYKYTSSITDLKTEWVKGMTPFVKNHDKVPDKLSDIIEICIDQNVDLRFPKWIDLIKSYKDPAYFAAIKKIIAEGGIKKHIRKEIKADLKKAKLKWHLKLLWIVLLATLLGVAYFSATTVYKTYINEIPDKTIPDITGLSIERGKEILKSVGLKSTVVGQRSHPIFPAGHIIESKPPAGRTVKATRLLRLIVSNGMQEILLPDFTGLDIFEAEALAENKHLNLQISEEEFSAEFQKGSVIQQVPTPNSLLTPSDNIWVTVSKGFPVNITISEARGILVDSDVSRKVSISFLVLDKWPTQRVRIQHIKAETAEILYDKDHRPGEHVDLSYILDLGDMVEVYFNDELAIRKDIEDMSIFDEGNEFNIRP